MLPHTMAVVLPDMKTWLTVITTEHVTYQLLLFMPLMSRDQDYIQTFNLKRH